MPSISRRFLKESFWVTLGQFGTSISAFVVLAVIANLVSKEALGEYRFVLAVLTILAITALPGLDTAVVQSTARGFTGQLPRLIREKAKWGVLGLLAGLLLAGYYFWVGNDIRATALAASALLVPLYGTYFIYFFYLQGKREFLWSSTFQIISRLFFAIFVVLAAFFLRDPVSLVVTYMAVTILTQYVGYQYTLKKYAHEPENFDPEVVPYGKKLTVLGAFNIIAVNIDKILVGIFLGAVPVAIYTIATLLPLESIRAGRIIGQVTLPSFSSEGFRVKTSWLFERLALLEFALFVCWGVYTLIAPHFFSVFFPTYAEAVPYSIVAMLIVLTAPAYVLRSLFVAQKYTYGINLTLIAVPVLKTIILAVALVLFGLWGAVWALVAGGVIELALHLYAYFKYKKTHVS